MEIKRMKNITEIELQGAINIDTSQNLSDKILLACNNEVQKVIVDLSRVTFIDSIGVAVLVEGLKWCKKEEKLFMFFRGKMKTLKELMEA